MPKPQPNREYYLPLASAVGICYFWPTTLGFTSEYLPKTVAMGWSLMGGAGMFSVSLLRPLLGGMMDQQIATLIPQGYILEALQKKPNFGVRQVRKQAG